MHKDYFRVWQIRGGRLTKWRGKVASIAPLVAMVGLALLPASGAQAACTLTGNTAVCSGTDNTTQTINFTGAGDAIVDIQAGYTLTATGRGIDVTSNGSPTSLTIFDDPTAPANISGSTYAFYVDYQGTGDIDINLSSTLTGTGSNDALYVQNSAAGGNIGIVTTGVLYGSTNHGIHVEQNGSGGVDVFVADGSVTGNTLQGIIVKGTTASAKDIYVTVGDDTLGTNPTVQGQTDGIEVRQQGNGASVIVDTENGTVIGLTQDGIQVTDTNSALQHIMVVAGDVQAGGNGINLNNKGTGVTWVAATGDITGVGGTGNATGSDGIHIVTSANSGTIPGPVITTAPPGVPTPNPNEAVFVYTTGGSIETGTDGIEIDHAGVGDVRVESNSGISAGAHGISVDMTNADAGALTINSNGGIAADNSGIRALTNGKGDATVYVGGAITANGNATGDVGVGVMHTGATGNVSLDVGAAITFNGTGTGEAAIYGGRTAGTTGNVFIDVGGAVESKAHGIIAENFTGTGNTTVYGSVTAEYSGIYIDHSADGDAVIDTTGPVVANGNATGNVGVGIDHAGTGNLRIDTGSVDFNGTGAAEYAIDGTHTGIGDITIIAGGTVDSETHGVTADHRGTGNISVETQAQVTAKGIGIDVYGGSNVGNIQVTAVGVDTSAGTDGIRVEHNGTGNAMIVANGTIKAGKDGIFLSTANTTQDVSITTAAAITAAENGIDATHLGANPLQITVGADVTGGSGFAIKTATAAGNLTLLNINSGTISSTVGKAISNNEGDSSVNLASAVTVQGDISLGNGTDVLNVNGADVSGVTLFDGGDDTGVGDGWVDVLNFNGVTLSANGGIFQNWEVFNLNTGSMLTATSGTMNVGQLNVDGGSTLNFGNAGAGALTISGDLTNAGTVTSQDGATGDQLTVGGNYSGDGTVQLDTFLDDGAVDTTDKLVINGDNNGDIALNVQNTGGPGAYTGNGPTDGIQVVQIDGVNNGTVFLANGPLVAGAFLYDVTNDGYLQSKPAGSAMGAATHLLQMLPASMESMWERVSSTWAFAPTAGGGGAQVAGYAITPTAATPLDMINGFWLRGRYRYTKADADVTVAGAPFQTTNKMHRIWAQLGYTHQLAASASGVLAGSVFGQYKRTSIDLSGNIAGVSSDTKANAFGGGASLTWLGADGLYGDLFAEVNRHRVRITEATTGASARIWATTWRVSIEGGWRMMVADGINLIPQAQLNIAGSRYNSFTVGGIAVSGNSEVRATGRIGMGLEMVNLSVDENLDLTAQLTASLLHDFSGGTTTINVGGNPVTSRLARTFGELRSNLNASVPGSGVSFFLENSFRHSLGGPKQYSFKSSVGVKISF